jgi:hypothetical protein
MNITMTTININDSNNIDSTTVTNFNSFIDSITVLQNKMSSIITSPLIVDLSIDTSVAELGSTVNSQTLKWTTSKDITSQYLNGTSIDKNLRSLILTDSVTRDTTYTLNCVADGSNTSVCKTLNFYSGIYWGVSSDKDSYDSPIINSLQNKVLSNDKNRIITVNAGESEYIYFCMPSSLENPIFSVNGFIGGFTKVANSISFTNTNRYVNAYDIWKSEQSSLGSTTIIIS